MKNNHWDGIKSFQVLPVTVVRALVVAGILFGLLPAVHGAVMPPGPINTNPVPVVMASWSFHDTTNWPSDKGIAPVSFTNLANSYLGNGSSLVVDTNVPAWLQYNIRENDGTTNLTVEQGTVMFWFAPSSWSSTNAGGNGPGEFGRLLEAGAYTADSSLGCWSLYMDDTGNNLYFSAQTNDFSSNVVTYLSAPIAWTTNYFHFVALTYSVTNTALYLDGALAASGAGMTVYPGPDALANGFFIGSDSNGLSQAHGLFNSVATYNVPLDADTIGRMFTWELNYYLISPLNTAMFVVSAPSSQTTFVPFNNVITGAGYLQANGPVSVHHYGTSANQVWITNVTAAVVSNGTTAVSFTIDGGQDGYMYDVFATGALASTLTNGNWAWLGQGGHFTNYSIAITMTGQTAFLMLGTPQDSDQDGLTDAYELLVSKSNPNVYSTDGTSMADGWEVLYFGHTGIDLNGDPDGDGLSNSQEFQMCSLGYNPTKWNSSTNSVVGDGFQDFSGDGLANLLAASFGGNLMTNNSTWKANFSGDGFPDEYKVMVGLNTNSALAAPVLPAYSKNPVQ